MKTLPVAIAFLAALSACSDVDPAEPNDRGSTAPVPPRPTVTETETVTAPATAPPPSGDVTATPANLDRDTSEERAVSGATIQETIPARFHGLWSENADHCGKPGHQRYDISARRIGFFESTGEVRNVRVRGDYAAATVYEQYGDGPGTTYAFYMAIEDAETMRIRYDTNDRIRLVRCPR